MPQVADEQSVPVEVEAARRTEAGPRNEVGRKPNRDEAIPVDNSTSTETQPAAPTPAIATVTVLIDPESGRNLGAPDKRIGEVVIDGVEQEYSTATVVTGSGFKRNQIVRFKTQGEQR